jgi:hypothetical protein
MEKRRTSRLRGSNSNPSAFQPVSFIFVYLPMLSNDRKFNTERGDTGEYCTGTADVGSCPGLD